MPTQMQRRPPCHPDTMPEYLDWVIANSMELGKETVELMLRCADLAIRVKMGDAQAKATQHTLVEDGVITQPNQ